MCALILKKGFAFKVFILRKPTPYFYLLNILIYLSGV
jgi:hypothetical protein